MDLKIRLAKPWIDNEEHQKVKQVLDSGYLTDGPVTREFEREVAKIVGTEFAIGTTSCATALDLGLRALGIKAGDEVIVPDYTHPATANLVRLIGAKPVLIPVDPKTYNITAELIKPAITPKTKCIIPVSLFGHPLDIQPIMELAKSKGIFVIEDAACSIGSDFDGTPTGKIADITCYSFHPRKVITTGEGDMLVTNNKKWADLAKSMKHFGATGIIPGTRIVEFSNPGTNYKLTNIQSAIGLAQLSKLDKITAMRKQKAKIYNKLIDELDFIKKPYVAAKANHIYQSYVTQLDPKIDRNKVIAALRERGIETQIGSYCLHIQPYFSKDLRVGDLSISKSVYDCSLALPLHHKITEEDQQFVIKNLKEVVCALE